MPSGAPPAVVVVSYNTAGPLRQSIASALREGATEIVVVDNASTDGSTALVRTEFPQVTCLANPTNRGYGAAANQGIAACAAPVVMLLNADASLTAGALAALAARLDARPEVAIVGPRLIEADGALQPSCYAFPGSLRWTVDNDVLAPLHRRLPGLRRRLLRTGPHDRERLVPWIKGAAMMIRRTAFASVGGFDEAFPLFYEETDLCRRLRAAGWQTLFSPVARVDHLGGASTGDREAAVSLQLFAGQVQYLQAHCPRLKAVWTALLKSVELPAQACDRARLLVARDDATRDRLRRRLAERARKIHLDPRRAGDAWRAMLQTDTAPPEAP